MTHTELLHQALLEVRANVEGPRYRLNDGICVMVWDAMRDSVWPPDVNRSHIFEASLAFRAAAANTMESKMERWPEFSGDQAYPVPAPAVSGWSAFEVFHRTGDKWAGEYGAARLRLLDWLIAETSPKRVASAGAQVQGGAA